MEYAFNVVQAGDATFWLFWCGVGFMVLSAILCLVFNAKRDGHTPALAFSCLISLIVGGAMPLSTTAFASVTATEHTNTLTTTSATVTSVSSDSVVVFDNAAELESSGYHVGDRAELVCFDI